MSKYWQLLSEEAWIWKLSEFPDTSNGWLQDPNIERSLKCYVFQGNLMSSTVRLLASKRQRQAGGKPQSESKDRTDQPTDWGRSKFKCTLTLKLPICTPFSAIQEHKCNAKKMILDSLLFHHIFSSLTQTRTHSLLFQPTEGIWQHHHLVMNRNGVKIQPKRSVRCHRTSRHLYYYIKLIYKGLE